MHAGQQILCPAAMDSNMAAGFTNFRAFADFVTHVSCE
jgi:hypothetical protein